LVITIVLVTIGTTGTGLLPGYSTIGVWAPILLVVARVFQGLSTGGEYVGAMTYIVEQAPDRKRGMVVGLLPLGNLAGFVAAGLIVTGLQTWLPSHDMPTWGWRVPLLLSAPLGLVAVFMRMRLDESRAYQGESQEAAPDDDPRQYRRTIAGQWKPMLICAALVYTSNAADYMLTGYLPTYLKVLVHIGPTVALAMITATLTILAMMVPATC
jgi:MHS family proline/betaine transporter-like MFS transporter